MSGFIANVVIAIGMMWHSVRLRRALKRSASNSQAAQHELLLHILEANQATTFGQQYGFSSIRTLEEYQSRVPVHDYDQLSPYIERQKSGEPALTIAPPVYYARTSGTTGRFKDIPLTKKGLQQVKQAQTHLRLSLWKDTDFLKGTVLGFASPAIEGRLENGVAFGSLSGSTFRSLPPLIAKKFVLPSSALGLDYGLARDQVFALAVLAADDLSGIAAANPSSILKLTDFIADHTPQLLAALEGKEPDWVAPDARKFLVGIVKRMKPGRLSALKAAYKKGALGSESLWPQLSAVATWTGGSCGVALDEVKRRLPSRTHFVEYGYGSSEFMGTLNVDALENHCLPHLTQHVYEFVERQAWESDEPVFLGIHQLVTGKEYYVFVTTQSGLYRYNIHDIVRAGEVVDGCHTLEFLQKGRGFTNITGEKLSEHQLITAVKSVLQQHQIVSPFFIALANDNTFAYELYVECDCNGSVHLADKPGVANAIDEELQRLNIEYQAKRQSGRLKPLEIKVLSAGAADTIKSWSLARGVREAQYKPVTLAGSDEWAAKLSPLLVAA